jgi:hypothetical protein
VGWHVDDIPDLDGRVISITSTRRLLGRTVDPDDVAMRTRYHPWRSYGRARLAACQLTIELDRRLPAAGAPVRALAADPGFAHTDLRARSAREAHGISRRFFGAMVGWFGSSPAQGALPQIRAATDPTARGGALYALRRGRHGPGGEARTGRSRIGRSSHAPRDDAPGSLIEATSTPGPPGAPGTVGGRPTPDPPAGAIG